MNDIRTVFGAAAIALAFCSSASAIEVKQLGGRQITPQQLGGRQMTIQRLEGRQIKPKELGGRQITDRQVQAGQMRIDQAGDMRIKQAGPMLSDEERARIRQRNAAAQDAWVRERTQRIDPRGQGQNQAQIDAMEMRRKLLWNSTGPGMVYQ